MRYAVVKWIAPLIVVEISSSEFDSPAANQLFEDLAIFFKGAQLAVIARDAASPAGLRTHGLACPPELLADSELVWRELILPEDPDVPF